MTKQKSLGIIDTPVNGVTKLEFPRAILNFENDYRIKTATPDEVTLVNITSELDRPETLRISRREISNVYQSTFGKGISPAAQASTVQGVELLAQWNGTFEVTDTTDADFVQHLPMQAHLVLKTPKGASVEDVKLALGRLLSSLFDAGLPATADAGLEAKLRGALTPKGL